MQPPIQVDWYDDIMALPLVPDHFYSLEYAKHDNLVVVWKGGEGFIRKGGHRYRVKMTGKLMEGPIPYLSSGK